MNVTAIIEVGLTASGYDGLVFRGICGCLIGDLSPGNCLSDECQAAYKHTHSRRPRDWITSTNPEPMTDEEIERCIEECC